MLQIFYQIGLFLLAAVLGGGLWYLKNACLTGNPVYPLFYSVLGGKAWDVEKQSRWNRVHLPQQFTLGRLADDLSRLVWRSEWVGPLIVPLAVLAFLRRSKQGLEKRSGSPAWPQPVLSPDLGTPDSSEPAWRFRWFLLCYLVWWVAMWWLGTHRIDRFWLPGLPMAALLAGMGFAWSESRLWRLVRGGMLAVGLGYGFLVASGIPAAGGYNRYFVSLERLRTDPQRVDPWHLWLNQHVKEGRVLLVGDAQPFDLEMPVLYATCFNTSPLEEIVWQAAARTNFTTGQPVGASGQRAGQVPLHENPVCQPPLLLPSEQLAGRKAEWSEGKLPADRLSQEFAQAVKHLLAEREIKYIFVHWGEIARYRSPGNYGFTPLVQPELFDAGVHWGVLEPLPPLEGHPGRCYRVRP